MSPASFLIVVASFPGVSASDIGLRISDDERRAPVPASELRVRTEALTGSPEAPWEVWVALGTGLRPETRAGAITGRVGVSRLAGRWFRPELELGTGAWAGDQQSISLMRLGARFEPFRGVLNPYLWAAFAHHHEVSFSDARAAPLGALLGLSGNGEIHRTGIDLGAGVSMNLPRSPQDRSQLRVGLRASVVHLLGQGPSRSFDLVGSMGATF